MNDQTIKLTIDGDLWCALMGENLQEGWAGFGTDPVSALLDLRETIKTFPAPLPIREIKQDEPLSLPAPESVALAKWNISDGYHAFDELYEHRNLLFLALIAALAPENPDRCWKSREHHDGSAFPGWFIAGMNLPPVGDITYHLPDRFWHLCYATEMLQAPQWDGHTSPVVCNRLAMWLYIKA